MCVISRLVSSSIIIQGKIRQEGESLETTKEGTSVGQFWLISTTFRDIWLQKSQVLDLCYLEENHKLKSCIA